MGFDYECILNIQSLAGDYFCPVCRLLVYPSEALQTQCTHLFCKPCLAYIVRTTHICPYDGYRVTESDSKPLLESNKPLADAIDKIQVRCLYYRTGCTWQGSLSDSTSHCSTCAFGESSVMCNRCGIQIVHRLVPEHNQNCPGLHSQAQQPCGLPNAAVITNETRLSQTQTPAQTVPSASQAQAQTQTYPTSAPLTSGAVANLHANTSAEQQGAPSVLPMPTPQQHYLQQCNYPYFPASHQYPPSPSVIWPPQACGQAHLHPQPQTPPQQVPVAQFWQICPQMQQPPVMLSGQGQAPSVPPAQHSHVYPHAQQPGYPFQHFPGALVAQQAVPPQSFSGQGPSMQQLPPVQAHFRAQGQSPTKPPQQIYGLPHCAQPNMAQNHPGGRIVLQRTGSQPHALATELTGAGQVSSVQMSQPQTYQGNNQPPMPYRPLVPQRPGLQMPQPMHHPGNPQQPALRGHQHNQVRPQGSGQPNMAQNNPGEQIVPQGTGSQPHGLAAELTGGAQVSSVQMSQPQTYQGNNQPPMPYRPLVPLRPGFQMPKPMPHPGNPQQPALRGHQHNHVRPQGSGQPSMAQNNPGEQIVPQGTGSQPHAPAAELTGGPQVSSVQMSQPQIYQGSTQPPMLYRPLAPLRPGFQMPKPMPHPGNTQPPALRGHQHNHVRPQGPGQVPPGPLLNAVDTFIPREPRPPPVSLPRENPPDGIVGPGLSEPLGRPPNLGHYHDPVPTYQAVQPPNPQGEPFVRSPFTGQQHGAFDSYGGTLGREPLRHSDFVEQRPPCPLENEKFPPRRPGYFEGRVPDSHPRGTTERGPFGPADSGVPSAVKFGSPSVHDSMSGPGMQDERFSRNAQEHSKPYSGPIDKVSPGFGRDSGLKTDSGFHDDNRKKDNAGHRPDSGPPGFSRPHRDGLPPRHPGSFGRSNHDGRFPVSPKSLNSVEPDDTDSLHRVDHLQRGDSIGPRNFQLGKKAAFGPSGGLVSMGELPMGEKLPKHLSFGKSSGGEEPGHSLVGKPGFRGSYASQRCSRDGKEHLDNARKQQPESFMCQICEFECGSAEGLDWHSQSREHQRKAMDMASSIKEHDNKKHRTSVPVEEGKDGANPKTSSFKG